MAGEREERPQDGLEPPSGQSRATAGSSRRGLGRGLGAILPARTAVPLELVGLGEGRGASAGRDEAAAPWVPDDRRRLGPNTFELRPRSRLRNHLELVAGLEQALAGARRAPGVVAVVVLGVDGFRHVNTAFGREAGDAMLRALGERLLHDRRRDDLVGRLQGDEFAVVCSPVDSALGARRAVERLVSGFHAPVVAGGAEHRLRATFGLAVDVPGEDGIAARSMLSRARLARQRAKEAGLRWAIFTPRRDGYQRPRWKTSPEDLRGLDVDEDAGSSPSGRPIRTAPT